MPVKSSILLERVRTKKPLVHHLTNWVTIYDCANIVKVFGASPVMAHAREEVAEMAAISGSVVLNIGTLTAGFVEAMLLAARAANAKGIPVVLDVCGAGATKFRDEMCFKILEKARVDIIKGNASEVARIAGEDVQTKGVDAAKVEKNLAQLALDLAARKGSTVVITGVEDVVADSSRALWVKNGHPMMGNIVGTGCMATSMIGTFAAVEKDLAIASAAGLACYEIAAEIAAQKARGPGSFKVEMFDAAFNLDGPTVDRMQKIERIDQS